MHVLLLMDFVSVKIRRLAVFIVAVFCLGLTSLANATCSFTDGAFSTATVNFGAITVTQSTVGDVIATKNMSYDSIATHSAVKCDHSSTKAAVFLMSGAGNSGIYPTNIPGIGVRVSIWASGSYYGYPTSPQVVPWQWGYQATASESLGTGLTQVRAELIVTGPISVGGTNVLSYFTDQWFQVRDANGPVVVANLQVNATLNNKTCVVTKNAVNVNLAPVQVKELNAGATKSAAFSLDINCATGAKVSVTLTDVTNPANRSNVLTLTPDSTAQGVGMQIFNGSTPIAYGPDSASPSNPNRWSVGTSTGGLLSVPLTVQYVRTTGTVGAGSAIGAATFTFSYQ
ncbi:fimbrial protein [Pseudomonas vancouverensis]|uniref:Uncharacterized protein n=1 Tax=Pseudomonas vancouverensis TaxID=95300 RepID=A0A1H2N2M3_PSEVA|nr:fimbrial protein [Pseudomonas vancouverensis]KAB0495785.1 hypothetical protein F7R09_14675 [Pseudomonas vancouverensis]TDB65587.1 hypothetical protein EIY72_08735 [Pseudomonas vancouverensis]SDU99594.1 Pilin (type 1 fimbria component protein) [Pseudomonas vancouverensis]